MTARDWDKEMAKIDKHLSTVSDDRLLARKSTAAPQSAQRAGVAERSDSVAPPTSAGVVLRVGLAAALAVAIPFWPYASHCGLPLAGYVATVGVTTVAGVWAAISAWRGRAAAAHLVALAVVGWSMALGAREVLPRIGYAKDAARQVWTCK